MSGAVSWMLEVAVKPGELENFRALMSEMVDTTRREEGTLAYDWSISDDGSECHIYERYADSDAVMIHLASFGKNFADRFLAAVDPTRLVVYGGPNEAVKEGLSGFAPVYLEPFGGFFR